MAMTDSHRFAPMPSTKWMLIADANQSDDQLRQKALESLLKRYLPALKAHLIINRRLPTEQAEDLLQGFVMSKVLERELFGFADPARGKFRTFLLTSLDRYVISQARQTLAKKRSPEPVALSDLARQIELDSRGSYPSVAYDVAWAREVLQEAVSRMEASCEASGRKDIWGVFQCRLLSPLLEGTRPTPYGDLAIKFGFASPTQASNILTTAKRMFVRTLRDVVGEYTPDPNDIEREIRELKGILSGVRA